MSRFQIDLESIQLFIDERIGFLESMLIANSGRHDILDTLSKFSFCRNYINRNDALGCLAAKMTWVQATQCLDLLVMDRIGLDGIGISTYTGLEKDISKIKDLLKILSDRILLLRTDIGMQK